MTGTYLRGIGMLVGMIFGAGVFALPFAFARASLFWGVFHFLIAFLILIFLHLWYGEVAYYTRGKHRFTGYTEIFLGNKAKLLSFLTTIGSYYGSLLVYGILAGIFLSNIFQNFTAVPMSFLFFIIAGFFALGGIEKIATINFYLTIPLFGFIVYLLFISLPAIDINNFFNNAKIFNGDWFLPYGVWLFALTGFSALPEARDIFSKFPINPVRNGISNGIKNFKRIIWLSLIISAIFYFVFIASVWGVSGKLTSEDALSGIAGFLGRGALVIGSLIGFLAVFTSYIALAVDMRSIFNFDYKISFAPAWLLSIIPPIILFFFLQDGFVKILSVVGTLGLGILGVFIILMRHKMRKRVLAGDPGDLIKPIDGDLLRPRLFWEAIILIGVLSAVIYELWRIFN